MKTYKIIRFFKNENKSSRIIRRHLTIEQAQAHCNDPETSSSTCVLAKNRARTRKHGEWFDGWTDEN